jgi:transposase
MGEHGSVERVPASTPRTLDEFLVIWVRRSGKEQQEIAEMLRQRGEKVSRSLLGAWMRRPEKSGARPMYASQLEALLEVLSELTGEDFETLKAESVDLLFQRDRTLRGGKG